MNSRFDNSNRVLSRYDLDVSLGAAPKESPSSGKTPVSSKAAPPGSDEFEIRRALGLLLEPGPVAELRVVNTQQATVSGYFTYFDKVAQHVAHYSGEGSGVHATLNLVNPDLLARANNRVKKYAKETTAERDILKRRWFPIDFDAKRPWPELGNARRGYSHRTGLRPYWRTRVTAHK